MRKWNRACDPRYGGTDEICTEYVNQVVNVMKEQGLVQE